MTAANSPIPPDEQLPGEIRQALVGLDGPGIEIPRAIDTAILNEAKASFLRRQRFWRTARLWGAVAAAAAVVAIAVHLFVPSSLQNRSLAINQRQPLTQAADINHDGRVNILDAYVLAQKIKNHEPLDPAWDLNGDGVVDQKDVDLIAGMAVQAAP